ncbi:MAG: LysM domain-containing protein [Planctomycetia bacterium]|nr:LysM domain-containing protein [Planctomycetia bacterium]
MFPTRFDTAGERKQNSPAVAEMNVEVPPLQLSDVEIVCTPMPPLEEEVSSEEENSSESASSVSPSLSLKAGGYPESTIWDSHRNSQDSAGSSVLPPDRSEALPHVESGTNVEVRGNPMVSSRRSHTMQVSQGSHPLNWMPSRPGINGRSITRPRTHIIVDGDTLEKLARRYLADPDRAEEIYKLNEHIIPSPEELTIGATIRIPERLY